MLEDLVGKFASSSLGRQAMDLLTGQGLTKDQATMAMETTAEKAAEHLRGAADKGTGGLAGIGAVITGLFGGGGVAGLPEKVVDDISAAVSSKTGLSMDMARMAVAVVLPKVVEFAKSAFGKAAAA